jgi:hypothetical protein
MEVLSLLALLVQKVPILTPAGRRSHTVFQKIAGVAQQPRDALAALSDTASAGQDTTSASDAACPADMHAASETDATSPLQRI